MIADVGMNIENRRGQPSRCLADRNDTQVLMFFTRFSELMRTQNFRAKVRELELTNIAIRHAKDGGTTPNEQVEPFKIITFDVRETYTHFLPNSLLPSSLSIQGRV